MILTLHNHYCFISYFLFVITTSYEYLIWACFALFLLLSSCYFHHLSQHLRDQCKAMGWLGNVPYHYHITANINNWEDRSTAGACERSWPNFGRSCPVTGCHAETSWHRDFSNINWRVPGFSAGVLCPLFCQVDTEAWFVSFQVGASSSENESCLSGAWLLSGTSYKAVK